MPGVKVVEEEKVPETVAVEKTMESMINLDGATLVFPTSFGYFDPHMLKMAAKYPNIQFRHCGGLWTDGKHPMNTGSYFGYIDEGQYLNGIVAGATSKSGKLGFVAAKPIPQVLRNVNAFTLGAQSVNPKITTQVIFTGDWSMPVKEAEATNRMIAQGVDVVTCHVDWPKVVIETAERAGIYIVRLSLQPGEARAQGLSHRRGVELGADLRRHGQCHEGRPGARQLRARRPQGRLREHLGLWSGRGGRGARTRPTRPSSRS